MLNLYLIQECTQKKASPLFYKRQRQYITLYYIANYLIIKVFRGGGVFVGHDETAAPKVQFTPLQYVAQKLFIYKKLSQFATAKVVKITTQSIVNHVFLQHRLIEYYLQQAFLRKPQHLQMQPLLFLYI